MKIIKIRIVSFLIVTALILGNSSVASAVMMKPSGIKPPPMSKEDDGYNPDSDPLPEWLLLPDGVDENSLSYSGSQKSKLTVKQVGSARWEILTNRGGASITYTKFENNKRQFLIKTSNTYSKFVPYVAKGKKMQRTESISPEDYFDNSTQLSLKEMRGFSLFKTASAYPIKDPGGYVNKKRVGSKLTKRQINKLNHKVGFKGQDAKIANKVAIYESGGGFTSIVACETGDKKGANPEVNGRRLFGNKAIKYCSDRGWGSGRGLYQISNHWHKGCSNKCSFSPTHNAKYAYKLRKKGGWTQWCAYGGAPCGTASGSGPAMQ